MTKSFRIAFLKVMDVTVIRSERRTISVSLDRKGRIVVRAPYKCPDEKILSFIESNKKTIDGWIEKYNSSTHAEPFTREEIALMKKNAGSVIIPRLEYYSKILNTHYNRVSFRANKSRWGSASSAGNLSFNCLLSLLDERIIDAVVVHELAHTICMNHSKQFYRIIYSVIPDYDERMKSLKKSGQELLARVE